MGCRLAASPLPDPHGFSGPLEFPGPLISDKLDRPTKVAASEVSRIMKESIIENIIATVAGGILLALILWGFGFFKRIPHNITTFIKKFFGGDRPTNGGRPSMLPGRKGSYLLWLRPPLANDRPRWVHFSWAYGGDAFCLRDFENPEVHESDLKCRAEDIWNKAQPRDRIACNRKNEIFEPVNNPEFWRPELDRRNRQDPR